MKTPSHSLLCASKYDIIITESNQKVLDEFWIFRYLVSNRHFVNNLAGYWRVHSMFNGKSPNQCRFYKIIRKVK